MTRLPGLTLRACRGAIVVAAALWAPSQAMAQEAATANLPLTRVVLFNSGVGFFERFGQVEDNAKVEMKFQADNINDLLMSMVVQDLDGGQVSTVNYASKEPITKTLKTFAIDLTSNPTLSQLLEQARGERVELEAPNKIEGVILGVESHKKQVGENQFIEIEYLNLLTEEGLRSVPLDTVTRIKLLNEKLDAELRKALAILATAHATEKKPVVINFLGKGKRRVRVGYIQEAPVWQTTYRMVLSDDAKPLLQGWAIVENPSEEDWSDVTLTLVSGRPISFLMDLYEPLYVPRPEVELQLYTSLKPQTYQQGLERQAAEFAARKRAPELPMAAARPAQAKPAARALMGRAGGVAAGEMAEPLNIEQGVESLAEAGEVGEMFKYAIATPVSLARQQSAMLPIVNAEVEAKKVDIYNQNVLAKHPLSGLRLTNSTDLNLMQGPITVFDGGAFAGDAMIENLPPKSERLVSYAIDLDVEVAPESKGKPEQLVSVRLLKGTMYVSRKYARSHVYTVKNSAEKPKTVLIEYPIETGWTLVEPKEPTEKTRDMYRFAVEAKPGEPATLTVEEEQTQTQQVALTNINDKMIEIYLSAKVVSDKVKQALQEIVRRKQEIDQLAQQRQQLEAQLKQIDSDQARIRQNMAQLDRTSDLYKSYVKKLSDQESQVESLQNQVQQLQQKQNELQQALDQYLANLDVG